MIAHFSLACASDGTVDPFPLAYIMFLLILSCNFQSQNIFRQKIFLLLSSFSLTLFALSFSRSIFIYENILDFR